MRFRNLAAAMAVLGAVPAGAQAQDSAHAAQLRAMVEQIARDRPPQAEAMARKMMQVIQMQQAVYDSLRARSLAEYWAEVAQLAVQRQMLEAQEDSMRRTLMSQMFGAEARARGLQRAYRDGVDSAMARTIRDRLATLLERHMAAEDSLRDLEVRDIERRIAQIRAETERRRREREVLVRRMVEQVLQDARQP